MPRILVSWNRNFSRPSGFLVLGVGVKSAKTLIRKDVEFKNLCVCVFFWVIFYGFYHGIHHHHSPPFGIQFFGTFWQGSNMQIQATRYSNTVFFLRKWVFPKMMGKPQIIHFNRVFHETNHPFWG